MYTAFAADTETGKKVKCFGQSIWFKETQDGKILAVYRPENDIDLYRVGKWDKPYKTLHYDGGRDDYYYFYSTPLGGMSFSPDGKKLAVVNHIWGKIIIFDVKTGRAEEIPSHIHYEQSTDYRYFFKLNLQERKLMVYNALSEKLLYTIKDCDWACFGYGGLLLTTDEAQKITTVRQASNGGTISSFEEAARRRDIFRSWYAISYDGQYISMINSYPNERYAVMRLTATGEMIQKMPHANNIIWSPRDNRFAVDMSGTAMNSKLSYITHMDKLKIVMKKAIEKLGGRTLSDAEREKYWLR